MSEIKEQIVERLRARVAEEADEYAADAAEAIERGERPDLWDRDVTVPVGWLIEAADRIEVLERERTNLIETKRTLEEALRPFAEAPADWTIYTVNAARLALNATPQDGKGGEEW